MPINAFSSAVAPLLLADIRGAQLLMVAGFVMLGWVLARRQIAMRKRVNRSTRQANKELKAIREQTQPLVPLCDAPVETQRWQVAMFDLQRDLKAELDTRIAIVQTLVRQADQRIEQLRRMESNEASMDTPSDPAAGGGQASALALDADQLSRLKELLQKGHTSSEIAEQLGLAIGDVELTISTIAP